MRVTRQIIDASKATYSSVENRLNGLFQKVSPRREFVRGLSRQIKIHPPAAVQRLTDTHFFLIVVAGAVSLAALVFVGVRTFTDLFKVRRRPLRQE